MVYTRDKYGNVTKVVADDAFGQHREQTTVYDNTGVLPEQFVNALGHVTQVQYDKALGVPTEGTDPNGLSTSWEYDGFGRLTKESRPNGSSTSMTRTREQIDGVWRLHERTTSGGGAEDETVFDSLGRTIATYSFAPQPTGAPTKRIAQFLEYDRLSGEVARKSVPIAEGTPNAQLQWDVYEYDAMGREIRHTTPWNAVTTTKYDGMLVEETEPLQVKTSTELDTLGRVVKRIDAASNATTYTYGPFNALRSVTAPGNTTTTWTRDAFGRVRKLDEPDRGVTNIVNDAFGDVVSSTDALGRTATWARDALGRAETRTDTHAGKTLTTSWTWDTAPNGIGELHTLTSPDALKTFSYTKKGQVDTMTLTVENDSFVVGATYDPFGRTRSIRYPQPLGVEPFEVLQAHDRYGHVIAVRDAETGNAYWELAGIDEAGRYAKETLGNGAITTRAYDHAKQSLKSITTVLGGSTIQQLSYDWTERLNLRSRTDTLQPQNKTERFRYDVLDRLTCAYFSPVDNPNAACASSYGYAANGNLTSKSDIGALTYADAKHPHAVTSTAGGAYTYDAVGNQIARPGGGTMTYTPFDLPKTITKNGQPTTFGYDGDEQRVRKTSGNTETIYVDDLFEQVTSGNGTEFRYYVHSPERAIAIVTRANNGAETTNWLNVDHLGSVESVTNDNGVVTEKRSYDPFGQRRNVNWGMPPPASFTGRVKPGFTGHDEEDEFGLINMKGRLYDPRIGRFTTTDPVITDIFNAQTLNPYGYVRNNPLTLLDPSGFNEEEAWRSWRAEDMGALGLHITFDKLTPPSPSTPMPPANVGADAPTNDTSTTGQTDVVVIPVVETEHPSGQGTDDPFGVYPPDLEIGYGEPLTTFDQLVTGDPAGGRTTFIIQDEPGLGRDIRHAFGPERQLIMLRPHFGGNAASERDLARENVGFEAAMTMVTLLTPGPLDDMATAGLRGAARTAGNLNRNEAISRFGIYKIWVNRKLYKIGKADMNRVTDQLPTRVHQQVEKLKRVNVGKRVTGRVVDPLGEVTTAEAKAVEKSHLYRYYNTTGKIPPGNRKSFKP